MLKIAVLTLIIMATLGVYASAQDPGMPDSAIFGDYFGPYLEIPPGGYAFLPLWIRNDEDLTYLGLTFGIDRHIAWQSPNLSSYFPLSEWEIFDTLRAAPDNPNYPEYIFRSTLGWADTGPPLNTDSIWEEVISYLIYVIDDTSLTGDTSQVIASLNNYFIPVRPIYIVVTHPTGAYESGAITPDKFAIANIYPNPFNSATTIYYTLPEAAEVALTVYDILGRKIETLDFGFQNAGAHSVIWDATGCNSGIYFARLIAGGRSHVARMVLVK